VIKGVCGFAYDCKNADALADFYAALLGWEKEISGEGWAALRSPQGWLFAFQEIEDYVEPVWPWERGKQQQMAHIDFYVENLLEAVEHAGQKNVRYNIMTHRLLCLIRKDIHSV